jgi:Pentapeptide repeats (8 copies)
MTVDGVTEPGALFPEVGGSAVIILVPVALFGASVFFLARQRPLWRFGPADLKAIGSSLLTGSLVSLAIFALGFYLDREAAKESKEEQFRLTLAVTKDLEGLDPPLPLAGLNLPDKVLDHAELAGEDLTDTNLAGASLRSANLTGAQLEGANLYRADLTGAQMKRADLDDAVLTSAKLRDATIYGRTRVNLELEGTDVDARTCWPADFLTSAQNHALRAHLDQKQIFKTGHFIRDEDPGRACKPAAGSPGPGISVRRSTEALPGRCPRHNRQTGNGSTAADVEGAAVQRSAAVAGPARGMAGDLRRSDRESSDSAGPRRAGVPGRGQSRGGGCARGASQARGNPCPPRRGRVNSAPNWRCDARQRRRGARLRE